MKIALQQDKNYAKCFNTGTKLKSEVALKILAINRYLAISCIKKQTERKCFRATLRADFEIKTLIPVLRGKMLRGQTLHQKAGVMKKQY
jgi:hypothetical protein